LVPIVDRSLGGVLADDVRLYALHCAHHQPANLGDRVGVNAVGPWNQRIDSPAGIAPGAIRGGTAGREGLAAVGEYVTPTANLVVAAIVCTAIEVGVEAVVKYLCKRNMVFFSNIN
jgi:hypothetical protein